MSESQSSPAAVAAAVVSSNTGRRRFLLILLASVIIIGVVSYSAWYLLHGRWFESTDDAYANGNVVQITPQVAGTVVSIGADDNARVEQGKVLAQFDGSDARVALELAEAALARAVRQVRGLYSNVGGIEAEVAARQVALERAKADLDRRQGLASTGAIPQEELSHAREAFASAQSALAAAQQQLVTSKALTEDTAITSHPEVKAAAANVRKAYLDLARTTLRAPVAGYVAQRSVQVGQRVAPGTPLMAVVPLNQLWVDANFKETQLTHMRVGQPVRLRADLYGSDVEYHGHISGLGVGTGSAFALLPAQNATGNWIKIVQRLPARIALDPKELEAHPLRIGLSMSVEVDMHDRSGSMLAPAAGDAPAFATDVYRKQLGDADARIAQIIRENAGHGRVGARP